MWMQKTNVKKREERNGLVAVAIDRKKGSQHALKWAADNLVPKGQTLILLHVNKTTSHCGNGLDGESIVDKERLDKQTKDLFTTFHCYCTRKDIPCLDIALEDNDIVKALTEYASYAALETLVLGAPSRHGFIRKFKMNDVPSHVSKTAPDFCTVYVISKGKVSSVRNASRAAPHSSPLMAEIENHKAISSKQRFKTNMSFIDRTVVKPFPPSLVDESVKSPFVSGRGYGKLFSDFSDTETDISFISSGRPSTSTAGSSPFLHELSDVGMTPRQPTSLGYCIGSMRLGTRLGETSPLHDFSFISQDSGRTSCSCSSQGTEEVEAEMKRLKLELKKTMDMYSSACREALAAKNEALELQRCRAQEEKRLEVARLSEESAMPVADRERAKSKAAVEAAKAAKRIVGLEAQRIVDAEMSVLEGSKKVPASLPEDNLRCRRYTIEEIEEATDNFAMSNKIGEGGYGPVFKCYLDHTRVAVKVLRPDAAQGRTQFQCEVDVLSCIRHPNMVLLLGACPEYGILVYEHMAKGSLADRLYRRENTAPLSWQLRFRIAAEIATGLHFLHQTKPEPLVHRDLKPGNILLDQNYVCKISDVGLARLVPTVAENMTQCHFTSAAGTFCYIDPEYQQTGMLGVKSDVYSFGILLLEMLTAKQPMGLAYNVEQAIQNDKFKDILDPAVLDWPVEEALTLARLALQCAELRRKDRPDLGKVVLPELNRLRELAEESMGNFVFPSSAGPSPIPSQVSTPKVDEMSVNSESSKIQSSFSSDSDKPLDQTEEG